MTGNLLWLASLSGLRVEPSWADTWWLAAVLAVVFVTVAYWIERYTIDTPRAAKGRMAITAFVVLAVLHVAFALGLRLAVWTPGEDPRRFHSLIAEENYRLLDELRATQEQVPEALEQLELSEESFRLGANEVRYFRDAWGRPLTYDAETGRLISAGPDGEFGTERDVALPRPPPAEQAEEPPGA